MATRARRWNMTIEGAEAVIELFDEMEEVAESILDGAAKKAGEFVLNDAKRRVPVDTGALKNSLDIKQEKKRKPTKSVYRVYSKGVSNGGVRYAFAVEAGTSKMPARPFIRPALDENRQKIKQIINDYITDALGRL